MTHVYALFHVLLALTISPLLLALINRVKAFFGGRSGPSLLQPYYDLFKLLRKGTVYSRTTSWVFRAGPVVGTAAVLTALFLTPLGDIPGPGGFPGRSPAPGILLGVDAFFYRGGRPGHRVCF